ncbi:hypothetical protein MNBD_GAMMA12-1249 [hydrothermal vent metagenome]|uniref:Mobile element protein n=1 Tax=hydrothermal vent metagenome TaxID=652676 RepID=A0A3B0Y3W4_9ZZZZ
MLGFKSFSAGQKILVGVELVHMIKKGQRRKMRGDVLSSTDQFYALTS